VDLIIRGRRVVLPDTIAPRSVHVRDGRILSVTDYDDVANDCELIEIDDDSVSGRVFEAQHLLPLQVE